MGSADGAAADWLRYPVSPGSETVPETTEGPALITENQPGTADGYDYELWKDYGTTEMLLTGQGTFTCSWRDINNALFRSGRKFDCTGTWEAFGAITLDYGAEYYPVGNSYLCIYGWTREPLVEYYVVQSWASCMRWR